MKAFTAWLHTPDAYDVLDNAVLGCLSTDLVDELCEDFGITRGQFRVCLNEALISEGL